MKILLSTIGFQETPGPHHEILRSSGLEVINARGPLSESMLLGLTERHRFVGLLNGDDAITARVIDALLPDLKVICKYGVGLDSIDVDYATSRKIPVLFTPGVNHTTVAEHTIGLMVALTRNFWPHLRATKQGTWERNTGNELMGMRLAVVGVGRIGKEVIKRARAFDMTVVGYDRSWDTGFADTYTVQRAASLEEALLDSDMITLHLDLSPSSREVINHKTIAHMKRGAYLINTSRGGLVNELDIVEACRSGHLAGYATDSLTTEPMVAPHVFQTLDNIIVTPHIGSRTFGSVRRQSLRAALNITNFLKGNPDFIQANKF